MLFAGGLQLDGTGVRCGRQHVSLRVRGVRGIHERRLRRPLRHFRVHRPQRAAQLCQRRGQLSQAAGTGVSRGHAARSVLSKVHRSSADHVQVHNS